MKASAPVRPLQYGSRHGTGLPLRRPDLLLERLGPALEARDSRSQRFSQVTAARGEHFSCPTTARGFPPGRVTARDSDWWAGARRGPGSHRGPGDPAARRSPVEATPIAAPSRRPNQNRVDPESLRRLRVPARRVRAFLHVAPISSTSSGRLASTGECASLRGRDERERRRPAREHAGSWQPRPCDRSAGEALIERLRADTDELRRAVVATLKSEGY